MPNVPGRIPFGEGPMGIKEVEGSLGLDYHDSHNPPPRGQGRISPYYLGNGIVPPLRGEAGQPCLLGKLSCPPL